MNNILDNIIVVSAAGGFFLICFVILIICLCISVGNRKKLNRIMMNSKNGNLAEAIEEYYEKINKTAEELHKASEILDKIERDCANALGQVAVVKFDAYNDLHGNYSFAAAVLNQHNDGIVITSLYGHDSCNTYIKNINGGESSVQLMNEEKEAVAKALYKGNQK
ncbi:MAG: DUF4446 family protein [Oscillospiraceae bacterium]|nr:DUF4446 family protein [Oscillospiraceae bacterium]